jgi:hypothetical protein
MPVALSVGVLRLTLAALRAAGLTASSRLPDLLDLPVILIFSLISLISL